MIYLDNNATTPPDEKVISQMHQCLTGEYGNPSSAHSLSISVRRLIKNAREQVAGFLGANSADEIVFTSGGTESDNWAILGSLAANPSKREVVTTRVEHEAVRVVCEKLESTGYNVIWLDVDEHGNLDPEQLKRSVSESTAVVSIMLANNETGVIFPVEEFAEIVKARSQAVFHVDGVNAVGKIPVDLKTTGIDLFSISAHKFHGPKGIGALYVAEGVEIDPNSLGGSQESGRRAGTEAVHQIVGLGVAAELASDLSPMSEIRRLRDQLESSILDRFENAYVNGGAAERVPNTTNISFSGLNGELILNGLDDAGVCVSTGSACNESNHVSSPVLRARDIPYSRAMGAIRFSLGRQNTAQDIRTVLESLDSIVQNAKAIAG